MTSSWLMQGRFGFRRISSIFIMLSVISFRGPISSLNILFYSIFPPFGLFFGSPVGCVLVFLRFHCRICIGDLLRGVSCSLILSLASMLLPLVWHCIAFCLVYPCILVQLLFLSFFFLSSNGWLFILFQLRFLFLLGPWILSICKHGALGLLSR